MGGRPLAAPSEAIRGQLEERVPDPRNGGEMRKGKREEDERLGRRREEERARV